MLKDKWFDQMRRLIAHFEGEGKPQIEAAAQLIFDSVTTGGALHIHDSGHMLMREAIGRAGGMYMVNALEFGLSINNPVRPRANRKPKETPRMDRLPELPKLAIQCSQVKAGDVVIVGSVSGRNAVQIGLAIAAQEEGAKVIALTSVDYSSQLTSTHPSGKRLFEVADVVVDNGAEFGDASLEVEGLPVKCCPTSGIGAAMAFWAITAELIGKLVAAGHQPSIYMSVNRDDGPAFIEQMEKNFFEKGI